jgi:hypothetical protein
MDIANNTVGSIYQFFRLNPFAVLAFVVLGAIFGLLPIFSATSVHTKLFRILAASFFALLGGLYYMLGEGFRVFGENSEIQASNGDLASFLVPHVLVFAIVGILLGFVGLIIGRKIRRSILHKP